jgi:hypothetical protein
MVRPINGALASVGCEAFGALLVDAQTFVLGMEVHEVRAEHSAELSS